MSYLYRHSIIARLRRLVQVGSTAITFGYWKSLGTLGFYQGPAKGFCIPIIHCFACPFSLFACPLGSIQHFFVMGEFPYYVVGIILMFGATVGRMSCGWLCPFGLLQDFVYRFGRVKWRIPDYMAYIKYFFLVVTICVLPLMTHEAWFCRICPVGKLEAGIPFIIWDTSIRSLLYSPESGHFVGWWALFKFFVLFLFVLLMSVSKRPFCKILCPMGAILAFFNRVSMVTLTLNNDRCEECNCCSLTCPMDLNVPKKIDTAECIRCLKCTACNQVDINFLGNKLRTTKTRKGLEVT